MGKEEKRPMVRVPREMRGGLYANNMSVSHSGEEFVMDFIMAAAPGPQLIARIIVSPPHIKRVIQALQENMEKYESTFGKITTEKRAGISFEYGE